MVALTRRTQDALTVLLAASGIAVLSVVWAVNAPGDETPQDEAPAAQETTQVEPSPAEATSEAPREKRTKPAFAEDFEDGLDGWPVAGSAAITDETASQGQRSATLTSTACRGDAFSGPIEVDAGATYRLRTDYRTDGGGGYIGVDLYGADGAELGEEWLIGDGGFRTYEDVRWRYHVDDRDPEDLGIWGRYAADYVIPDGVASVRVKIEDWGCGGLPDDPAGAPVYFDRIRWTPLS